MPAQSNEKPPVLIWILIAAGIWWWSQSGQPTPVIPTPSEPDVVDTDLQKVVSPAESEYWTALGMCVEKKTFGALQQHTDHLLQIVDLLKQSGSIKDDSRVADWRSKRVEITDANRSAIASKLRGP